MKSKFLVLTIVMGLLSQTSVALSKTQINTPANNAWLGPIDDPVELDIKGTSTLPKGTDIVLTVGKEKLMGKIEDNGVFNFSIDQAKIRPLSKTKIEVRALKDSASVEVFCCSTDEFAFFEELEPNHEYKLTFKNSKSEIDGVKILIPKTSIKVPTKMIVSANRSEMINLPDDDYIPLSGPVSVDVSSSIKDEELSYIIPMQLNIPRNNLAQKTTPLGWMMIQIGEWKDVDPKKHKIVILAQTFKGSEQVWSEIIPQKISKDSVEFKVPKNIRSNLFVVAAKKKLKK